MRGSQTKKKERETERKRDSMPPLKPKHKPQPEMIIVGKEKVNELLVEAAYNDDFEKLKDLSEVADINARDEIGYSALMRVVECGNLEATEFLIGKTADVNCADKDGITALMIAASYGELEIVKLLVEKGAEINVIDDFDKGALDYALKNKNDEIVQFLKEKGAWE